MDHLQLTDRERLLVEHAAEKVAERTVTRTLKGLGIPADDPIEFQERMVFLRDMKNAHDFVRSKGIGTAIVLLVTAGVSLLGLGIKARFFPGG